MPKKNDHRDTEDTEIAQRRVCEPTFRAKPRLGLLRCFSFISCIEPREHVLNVAGSFYSDIDRYRRIPHHARSTQQPPEPMMRHQPASSREKVCGFSRDPTTIAAAES